VYARTTGKSPWLKVESPLLLRNKLILLLQLCRYAMEGHRTDIPEYDTSIVDRLRTSLVSNFETLKLDRLTDLRLSMATTYDIAQLGSALSDNVCSQLKHLFLEYVDATGTGGSNKYFQYTNGRGLSVHSNLQKKYPNIRHMRGLCGLVDRCPNIESVRNSGIQNPILSPTKLACDFMPHCLSSSSIGQS